MKLNFLISFIFIGSFLFAQKQTPLDIALRHLEKQRVDWRLSEKDISNIAVGDQYLTQHNNVNHIYLRQQHASIEVFNAIVGIHVDAQGNIAHATNRFFSNLAQFINTENPSLSPEEAIRYAFSDIGLDFGTALKERVSGDEKLFLFEAETVSTDDIKVKLVYQPLTPKDIRLAWQVDISPNNSQDIWGISVDAVSGQIVHKHNYTLYCSFGEAHGHIHHEDCREETRFSSLEEAYRLMNESSSYTVFPFGVESPIHGDRAVVTSPADLVASPFGWHDADGEEGADFTITFGNNTHAFLDRDSDLFPDGPEPDGGEELVFDFPFDPEGEPTANSDAAVVQLFYMSNIMHDFSYAYGFDEVSGNFQLNNYGKGGKDGDYLLSRAQNAADSDDPFARNNASFGTQADGSRAAMQMLLWNRNSNFLVVDAPSNIAGNYRIGTAGFGPSIFGVNVSGEIALAFDGDPQNPQFACGTIVNANEVNGKIAMVDRGECFFERKVVNLEAAGAIAVIVCNREDAINFLGGSDTIPDPGIPAISMRLSDCQTLKAQISNGVTATISASLPAELDSGFDNGVVAHEYGHGISIRLTGGPSTGSCLGNGEQMGEGWSDFFTLITSIQDGDNGIEGSGIGTYLTRGGTEGPGIRRQRYSTDMNVNNQTYADIRDQSAPHQVGEPWAVMLWDMFWKFVEVYGWDPDQFRGNGGNNMAIQLVMDGMKLQACNPGFVDARDAILAADQINNKGVNQCMIWEVFARRGLGWSADQGEFGSINDGLQAFDLPPFCTNEPSISKTVTPLINAGEDITVAITVRNQTENTMNGLIVTDELPEGLSFIPGSASPEFSLQDNGSNLEFTIGTLEAGATINLFYQVETAPDLFSISQLLDDVEAENELWTVETALGNIPWAIIDTTAFSGSRSWYIPDADSDSEHFLQLSEPVTVSGGQPVIRFYHRYEIETAWDGGVVELSIDGGLSWFDANPWIFRHPYSLQMHPAGSFGNNSEAFSGISNGFVATYINLSDFIDSDIQIRFRMVTDQAVGDIGWFLDDIQFIDMFNYDGEACVSVSGISDVCARAEGRGTVIEPGTVTSTEDPSLLNLSTKIYPNPVRDLLNIAIDAKESAAVQINLMSTDGRLIRSIQSQLATGTTILPFSVEGIASGIYFLQLNSSNGISTHKVVVR